MTCRLTTRAALALGLRSLARDAARFGRKRRALFAEAERGAGRGSAASVALLVVLCLAGL